MKAIQLKVFGPPENLYLGTSETPQPKEKEVLVKVAATALNRADTLQRKGFYPPPPGASPILGLEMAGVIESLGSNATKWKEGDRVCGLLAGGGYAEYVTIHEDLIMPVPESWSMTQAAGMPEVFLTAFQALVWLGELKAEERILIHAGASGVGTAALQIARAIGAESIVTASGGKHDLCLSLGATKAINYREEDFKDAVMSFTKEEGVDVVLDFLAASYFQRNLDVLRADGRLVILALMGGIKAEEVNLAPILRKRIHIKGSTLRARSLAYKVNLTQAFRSFAEPLFSSGVMKPIIDSVYPWTEVAKAHQYMEENRNQGKIVLEIT